MRRAALAALLVVITALADAGESPSSKHPGTSESDTREWQCELRAWTRAPDLAPGIRAPGHARLAMNGSECGEVVRWEVGLRLKERAIIKLRSKNAHELPPKPEPPVWNSSSVPNVDWNDIYAPMNTFISGPRSHEYETALAVYNEAMQNASLWDVKSQERVVFDIKREMDWAPTSDNETDVTDSFAIHVPLTNFPPIAAGGPQGATTGKDGQMLNTETLSEYYHLIHLRNGTIVDIPAGRSGFLSLPSPIHPGESARNAVDDRVSGTRGSWPQVIEMASPRNDIDETDSMWMRRGVVPECDKGNNAAFRLDISSNITQPVQGHNITLNVTLTRSGNGTEYPTYIDFRHATSHNVTWAYRYLSDPAEYDALTNANPAARDRHRSLLGMNPTSHRMLMVSTEEELKRGKKMREEMRQGGGSCTTFGDSIRWPVGPGAARYDFEERDEESKEVYEFAVEMPIPHDEYPTFEKTFESLRSIVQVTLHTAFLCAAETDQNGELRQVEQVEDRSHGQEAKRKDEEWTEYALPLKKMPKKRRTAGFGQSLEHTAMFPLDLRRATVTGTAGVNDAISHSALKHYIDTDALGPVMTRVDELAVEYPLLGNGIRDETVEEQRKNRWELHGGARSRHGRCKDGNGNPSNCWSLNGGGGWMHAAKLWMGYDRALQEGGLGKEGEENVGQFVIQA